MRISGGAQAAIDDLRMAEIYVSPAEESASKILEMSNNNPFADALTAMLDGGNSVFIHTFQDKVFKLPVRKKDGNIAAFNTVATIDLSNKTVKEILDSAEIR